MGMTECPAYVEARHQQNTDEGQACIRG